MNKLLPVFCFVLLGMSAFLFYQNQKLQDQVAIHSQLLLEVRSSYLTLTANVDSALQAVSVILGGDIQSGDHQFSNKSAPVFSGTPYCSRDDRELGVHMPLKDGSFKAWYIQNDASEFNPNDASTLDLEGRYTLTGRFVLLDAMGIKEKERVKRNLIINNMLENGQIVEYHSGNDFFNFATCPNFVKVAF